MKSITTMSNDELSEEFMRVEDKIKDVEGRPHLKSVLHALKALRFSLACVARQRNMLVLQSDLQHASAPATLPSNVVDLAEYRARRALR